MSITLSLNNDCCNLPAAATAAPPTSRLGRLARRLALAAALGLGTGYFAGAVARGDEISPHASCPYLADAMRTAEVIEVEVADGETIQSHGGVSILVHEYDFDDTPACPAAGPPVAATVAEQAVPFVDHFRSFAAIRRTSRSLGRLLASVTGPGSLRNVDVPPQAGETNSLAEVVEVTVPTPAKATVKPAQSIGLAQLDTSDADRTLDAILSLDAWWLAAPTIAAQRDPSVATAFNVPANGSVRSVCELIPSDPAVAGVELPSPIAAPSVLVGSAPVIATLTESYLPYDLATDDLSLPAEPVAAEHRGPLEVVEVPVDTAPRTILADVHLSPETILVDWIERTEAIGQWLAGVRGTFQSGAAEVQIASKLQTERR